MLKKLSKKLLKQGNELLLEKKQLPENQLISILRPLCFPEGLFFMLYHITN